MEALSISQGRVQQTLRGRKPNENLAGTFNNSLIYSVSGSIVSTQNIVNGNAVKYQAGTYIELNNGFVSGTDFIAEINPCVSTVTVIAAKTEDSIDEPNLRSKNLEIKNGIKIYPTVVASGDAINVEVFKATQKLSIVIFGLQAQVVQQNMLTDLKPHEPYSLLLNNLSYGLYLVKAHSNFISITQKIIVK